MTTHIPTIALRMPSSPPPQSSSLHTKPVRLRTCCGVPIKTSLPPSSLPSASSYPSTSTSADNPKPTIISPPLRSISSLNQHGPTKLSFIPNTALRGAARHDMVRHASKPRWKVGSPYAYVCVYAHLLSHYSFQTAEKEEEDTEMLRMYVKSNC
jgi:hypothetical protein